MVAAGLSRTRVRVAGVVQGVGFRPFVYHLARELGLAGFVLNDGGGVLAEVEGPADAVAAFLARLKTDAPAAARVDAVATAAVPPRGERGFVIAFSEPGASRTLVSPDLATCEDCLRELREGGDRRFGYPFLNCTQCGPRFTIIRGVPYDRPNTTMAAFTMCAACRAEYDAPGDRRFHAQPNACAACGPRLALWDRDGVAVAGVEPLAEARRLLAAGAVVAVKGLGGYHLACDGTNARAVEELRRRKTREEKPFAIMARDADVVRAYCELDAAELRLLTSPRRPIVLLRKRGDFTLPEAVAPGNKYLGVMLPYTPLHHLLFDGGPGVLVMTSGNRADEPLAYRDNEVVAHLRGIADCYLTHDRPVARRVDDSVTRAFRGREYLIRRSRGYVPLPVDLGRAYAVNVLAVGAELKNTFCLTRGRDAFLSHHIGDMENAAALASFEEGIADFRRLLEVELAAVARDLHPDYLPSRWAEGAGLPVVTVQHHHAHIAAVLADAAYDAGPVIGFAFDGAGLGDDGTVWGGEVLIADRQGYRRAAHLRPVPLPGGDRAVREPWRMALAWLEATYGADAERCLPPALAAVPAGKRAAVLAAARRGVNAPRTSSVGRLFDAVAALAGVRSSVSYEGQAAADLEQRVADDETGAYAFAYDGRDPLVIGAAPVIDGIIKDLRGNVAPGVVAARFHHAVAAMIVETARRLREGGAPAVVALGGGVFQNVTLLTEAQRLLQEAGFRVLIHSQVPTNDGGLALGQAAVALARLTGGS
jgi:hydrogenase maturation protein HypF